MEKADRGSLVLSAPRKSAPVWGGLTALFVVIVVADLYLAWRNYQLGKAYFIMQVIQAAMFAIMGFVLVTPRSVRFFEKGVRVPHYPMRSRSVFLPWSEVERYYWVGDVLYLSTVKAVHPCAIQPRIRPRVETVLARYVAQPNVAQPNVAQPDVAQPDVAQPTAPDLGVSGRG